MPSRIIGHLDMDAFFAAIEERATPRFAGQPLVVGADPRNGTGRGVVSTANYAARVYGIRSAMPIRQAWQLSEQARRAGQPPVIFVSGNWRLYSAVSKRIMDLVRAFGFETQQRSVDEIYVDLSSLGSFGQARRMGEQLKQRIWKQEGLSASVGIGSNKLVAKIASDAQKPDGLVVVEPEQVQTFLDPLPITVIPGVGPKTGWRLRQRGITTIREARAYSRQTLISILGIFGGYLYEAVRGIHDAPLRESTLAKSMSEQCTFRSDTLHCHQIVKEVCEICDRLQERLHEEGFASFRTVTIMVRFASFTTKTRSRTLRKPISSPVVLRQRALQLLLPFFDRRENPQRQALRLVGVRLEKLR